MEGVLMSRTTLRRIHVGASVAALLTVAAFLGSTLFVEAFGDHDAVRSAKLLIVRAVVVLVAVMAVAAVSGRRLAGRSRAPVVLRKLRRMKAAAAIGVLVLIPCAVILAWLAVRGRFDNAFAVVQAVELGGGAVNFTLLMLNFRDGMALTAGRRAARLRRLALVEERR
jgi:hypothetical protein